MTAAAPMKASAMTPVLSNSRAAQRRPDMNPEGSREPLNSKKIDFNQKKQRLELCGWV